MKGAFQASADNPLSTPSVSATNSQPRTRPHLASSVTLTDGSNRMAAHSPQPIQTMKKSGSFSGSTHLGISLDRAAGYLSPTSDGDSPARNRPRSVSVERRHNFLSSSTLSMGVAPSSAPPQHGRSASSENPSTLGSASSSPHKDPPTSSGLSGHGSGLGVPVALARISSTPPPSTTPGRPTSLAVGLQSAGRPTSPPPNSTSRPSSPPTGSKNERVPHASDAPVAAGVNNVENTDQPVTRRRALSTERKRMNLTSSLSFHSYPAVVEIREVRSVAPQPAAAGRPSQAKVLPRSISRAYASSYIEEIEILDPRRAKKPVTGFGSPDLHKAVKHKTAGASSFKPSSAFTRRLETYLRATNKNSKPDELGKSSDAVVITEPIHDGRVVNEKLKTTISNHKKLRSLDPTTSGELISMLSPTITSPRGHASSSSGTHFKLPGTATAILSPNTRARRLSLLATYQQGVASRKREAMEQSVLQFRANMVIEDDDDEESPDEGDEGDDELEEQPNKTNQKAQEASKLLLSITSPEQKEQLVAPQSNSGRDGSSDVSDSAVMGSSSRRNSPVRKGAAAAVHKSPQSRGSSPTRPSTHLPARSRGSSPAQAIAKATSAAGTRAPRATSSTRSSSMTTAASRSRARNLSPGRAQPRIPSTGPANRGILSHAATRANSTTRLQGQKTEHAPASRVSRPGSTNLGNQIHPHAQPRSQSLTRQHSKGSIPSSAASLVAGAAKVIGVGNPTATSTLTATTQGSSRVTAGPMKSTKAPTKIEPFSFATSVRNRGTDGADHGIAAHNSPPSGSRSSSNKGGAAVRTASRGSTTLRSHAPPPHLERSHSTIANSTNATGTAAHSTGRSSSKKGHNRHGSLNANSTSALVRTAAAAAAVAAAASTSLAQPATKPIPVTSSAAPASTASLASISSPSSAALSETVAATSPAALTTSSSLLSPSITVTSVASPLLVPSTAAGGASPSTDKPRKLRTTTAKAFSFASDRRKLAKLRSVAYQKLPYNPNKEQWTTFKTTLDVVEEEGEVKVNVFITLVPEELEPCDPRYSARQELVPYEAALTKRWAKAEKKLQQRRRIKLERGPNTLRTFFCPSRTSSLFIPSEVLLVVLEWVDVTTLCTAAMVCRQWNIVAEADPAWRPKAQRDLAAVRLRVELQTEEACKSGLEYESFIFEPLFPRRWKDAVRDSRLGSKARLVESDGYVPIVIDNGGCSLKAGFAKINNDTGEVPQPSLVIPSAIAFPKPTQELLVSEVPRLPRNPNGSIALNKFPAFLIGEEINPFSTHVQERYNINYPLFSDRMESWEDVSSSYAYVFDTLMTDPSEHPVLATQPIWSSKEIEPKLFEILFETFNVPAAYIEKAPLLAAYAYGDLTGIVVDIGASSCQIVPIYEGAIFSHSSKRLPHLGGARLTAEVAKWLANPSSCGYAAAGARASAASFAAGRPIDYIPDVVPIPTSPLTSRVLTREDCDRPYYATCVAQQLKDRLSCVCPDFEALMTMPRRAVEILANGKEVEMAPSLLGAMCGEVAFGPQLVLQDNDGSIVPLHSAIATVVESCAIDTREALLGNIVLSGGGTMASGFTQRLEKELQRTVPHARAIKVRADPERQHAVWTGGSILTQCDPFQNMWKLKGEYEDEGVR